MGLYEKIYNVMCESTGLDKSMVVGSGSYQYKAISEAEVLNTIKPLLKKHKLILIPIDVEISEIEERKMTQLKAKYKIIDIETGESEILATVGNGADSQDKGSGKAWTYAYKALVQKTFCLFSGEDTDNDHSKDLEEKNSEPQKKQSKTEGGAPKQTATEKIDKAKQNVLTKKAGKRLKAVLNYYKVDSVEDLTVSDFFKAMKKLDVEPKKV